MKYYFICVLYFCTALIYSQNNIDFFSKPIDSIEKIFINLDESEKIKLSSNYLKKAKHNNNQLKICNGYFLKSLAHSHTEKAIQFADSLIYVAQKLKNNHIIAKGHLQKGIQLYYQAEYKQALDQYLLAKNHYSQNNDAFEILRIRHYVALLKNTSGQEKEALNIFKLNMSFFKKNLNNRKIYPNQYFKSLFALADSYHRNKLLDSSQMMNLKGLNQSYEFDNSLYPHFLISYGATRISSKEVNFGIDSLLKAVNLISNKKKSICGLYAIINEGYEMANKQNLAILYLKKIDSIYQKNPNVIFHAKNANKKLFDHYKLNNLQKEQLETINKILAIDSIIQIKHSMLSKQIVEKYDIPQLLSEKEKLIYSLKNENIFSKKMIFIFIILSTSLLLALGIYIRRNVIYKKRFKNLMNQTTNNNSIVKIDIIDSQRIAIIGVSKKIIEDVLYKLEIFENSNRFIKRYTLSSLAKELKTNSSYLSNIINSKKNENFSNYLNNLRIHYAIEKLKNDKKFRSYTIKAIAKEVGFNTSQSFSNAFYKNTGLFPSFFIKQLSSSYIDDYN